MASSSVRESHPEVNPHPAYVGRWSEGFTELVKDTAERVVRCAKQILVWLEGLIYLSSDEHRVAHRRVRDALLQKSSHLIDDRTALPVTDDLPGVMGVIVGDRVDEPRLSEQDTYGDRSDHQNTHDQHFNEEHERGQHEQDRDNHRDDEQDHHHEPTESFIEERERFAEIEQVVPATLANMAVG